MPAMLAGAAWRGAAAADDGGDEQTGGACGGADTQAGWHVHARHGSPGDD